MLGCKIVSFNQNMILFHIRSSSFSFISTEDFHFKFYVHKSRVNKVRVLYLQYNFIYFMLKGTKDFDCVVVLHLQQWKIYFSKILEVEEGKLERNAKGSVYSFIQFCNSSNKYFQMEANFGWKLLFAGFLRLS